MSVAKLTLEQKYRCTELVEKKILTQAEAARRYGVSTRTIWEIVQVNKKPTVCEVG